MNTVRYRLFACLVVALLILPSGGAAQAQGQGNVTFPYNETGVFTNAEYEIRVPENWNGVLLVYAHGYAFDAPPPAAAPGDPPLNEALEDFLLRQGYALAGSSYRKGGWAVKEGIQNTLALTNRFNGLFGRPNQTILWGFSMGSLIALELLDQHAPSFDGAVASCGPLAGAPVSWDSALALSLAYDVTFGWPQSWGTVGDVRDDVSFDADVLPVFADQLNPFAPAFPANVAKFEFIRRVIGLPSAEYLPGEGMGWLLVDMYFATQVRGELEARAGGPIAQNLDHEYVLSADDRAALESGFGFTPAQLDFLLGGMNARRNIEAARPARNYISRYAVPSGDLKRPVITMHNTIDGLALPWNEVAFAQKVNAAGKSGLLLQTYVDAVGHCKFTGEQMFAGIAAMHTWLVTGMRPNPAAAFPPAYGFVNDVNEIDPPLTAPPYDPVGLSVRAGATTSNLFVPLVNR